MIEDVVALQGFKYPPEFQSVEYLAFHSVRAQKGKLAAGCYQVADLLDLHGQAQAIENGPVPRIDHSSCPNFQGVLKHLKPFSSMALARP